MQDDRQSWTKCLRKYSSLLSGFLLDTNVVSESFKPRPQLPALRFLESISSEYLFLSVLTLGELRRGEYKWAFRNPGKPNYLTAWIDSIESTFRSRFLDVNTEVADQWAKLRKERVWSEVATLIAATALVHGLTIVTRNVKDFTDTGLQILNPWQE